MLSRRFTLGFLLLALCILATGTSSARAQSTPPVVINEILVGNASTTIDPDFTNYSAWIELQNNGGTPVSLAGYVLYSLPDGATQADRYTIPTGVSIPANGRLLFWADEQNRGTHVHFELDMDGGDVALLTPGGAIVDTAFLGEQEPDVSYGRSPNGGSGWAYYDQPTPGGANSTPPFADYEFAAKPIFSVPGGRHAGPVSIELTTTEPGATIRYTLDGAKPTAGSPAYSGPIALASAKVVRARTFAPGKMASPTATETYLINVPANLPTISIATDPAHMFDNKIGIFVVGTNGIRHCGKLANWHRPWERPASIEMYEVNGAKVVDQDVGFEIQGNCTRNYRMKSFEIKARKTYGDNDIDYAFFSDKPMTSYRRLVLRTSGQDTKNTLLRDALAQTLPLGHMANLDRQAYRPAVLYINGQFWGVYAIREKMDEDFVENNYGLDKETDFDYLEDDGIVGAGNADRWNAFREYLKTHNPADPAVYDYLQTQMDVDEFINYQIMEIYAANTDWPHNNIRYWRSYAPDSQWRWMLQDVDAGFGNHFRAYNHNTIKLAMSPKGIRAYGALVMNRLSTNPDFRAEFAQRFAAHLNTTFTPARVTGIINDMAAAIAPDMPAQTARWRMPRNMTVWQSELNELRVFADRRPGYMRGHLNSYLGTPGLVDLTVEVNGLGHVMVAGAPVSDGYSGPHFKNTPLTLRAIPAAGQQFVSWLETGETTLETTLPMSGPITRTAVFEELPPPPAPPSIVINELHYNPADAQGSDDEYEFIEIVNTGSQLADLSGFTIAAIDYTFPAGSTLAAGEYALLAKTAATYTSLGVQVFDWPDSGNLSNGGEAVILIDLYNQVVDEVVYSDAWVPATDGGGPSLSLIDLELDNNLAASWVASAAPGGTPGTAN